MRVTASVLGAALLIPFAAFAQGTPPAAGSDPAAAAPPASDLPPPPPAPPPEAMAPPPPPAPAASTAAGGMPVTGAMQTPGPDKAPAVVEQPWFHMVNLEALVDSYYQMNFSHLDNAADSMTGPSLRNFDVTSNSFSLNYAKIGLGLTANPVGFRLDLGYGHTGAIINAGSALETPMLPAAALYSNAFIVQQAYATLSILNGTLSVDMGKFVTTAGAEVIEANKNWLYSRSLLFYTIPLLHTGARVNYKPVDMLTLQASVVNGINNDPDNNANKTLGLSAALAPLPTTSIVATGYFGKRGPQGMEGDTALVLDLVGSHAFSDMFAVNLNLDYVKNATDVDLYGASAMARWAAHENLVLALRGEFINDSGVLQTVAADTKVYEGTLMIGFPFAKHFEARLEGRVDAASEPIFNNADNQFTGTLAFLGFM